MHAGLLSDKYNHGSSEQRNRRIILSLEMESVQLLFELNILPDQHPQA